MEKYSIKQTVRIALATAALLAAASATAGPPPYFSQSVPMCSNRIFPSAEIVFSHTTNTAGVRSKAKLPLGPGPYGPRALSYSLFAAAAVRKAAGAEWSIGTSSQAGDGGVAEVPAEVGHSTFRNPGCALKGSVTIGLVCPNGIYEEKTIERVWNDCDRP